ncbi:alginate export family protein [Croceibacterium sp. LX-88]|uniref:Alginate export family protein n=1 Tax=Croceibacterium selenioxidans TaxID=2838833 RepID=A0ABS5W1D3_9SPHN|nr:alginate export family protein [Croceibacterium selenioxidans]MBT2133035.1 alginate export family protein [Croceibacterium selenioxidans]
MKLWPLVPAVALCATAVQAEDLQLTPSVDARLRYENVEQDGLPGDADALTLRARPGLTAKSGEWSALVEAEATVALSTGYNDGLNGKTQFPLVADPSNLEINRAQIRYSSLSGMTATAGRQRIELADQRFVGPAAFRQNEQTFDALRVQWTRGRLSADLTYAGSVRTVNGSRGAGARPSAIDGDNIFALLGYRSDIGTLAGFAYLVDQDDVAVQGFRLSSQTYGVRLNGSLDIAAGAKLGYTASWARQSDYHRNPNDYSAEYWLGEATLNYSGFNASLGYEVLGADDGTPLTSVQTPLASFFRWNGWAGKFSTIPPDGLHDLYATVGHTLKKVGPLQAINLAATWHRFDSDRLDRRYGHELDLVLSARHGPFGASLRYAGYRADTLATDTDKLWLTLEWAV